MDKQVRYLPDLTAKNLNNKVEKERHHLKRQIKNRIIVPIYGCFYKEKLIVKDVFNKNILKHSVDYFLGGYRPNYSKLADGEIYSFIIINNDKVSESVEISYQAYGSVKADDSTITAQLLEDAFSSYEVVPFNKLKNLPKEYTPSLHYHDIGDIKEFQLLLFYLDQIRFCILADNKELFSFLAKIEKIIEAIINRALNSYDYLVFQKLRKYYEDFSLAMFGLDKVKNYPLMNFEDGFSIGDMTHPKMYSSLGEKYFSLKALEGFSKGLYSVYVNTEQTNLGYYKEKTVVPTISFLESMPIGASVTIPRLDSVELNQEIEKLYPDLEVKDCRYLVKKVASKNNNKNSCYIYIHRDTGRTYVMVGFLQNNEYKTIFYKIASSLDGDVIINSIDKHILDYDNPHLDDKRDVNLSKVENLPIATKEDIICNMPVRKYITLRNLLLFMKRFKTGTKNVTEIHEQLSPRSETRLMQTIFSACGSWKNIDPNKIELCRVIQKEEEPWIYISESTTQMWEGDEILIFTISCSDHYVNKTFVYKLVLDSTTIFTDALTIPLAQALDENFAQEFERWTREVSIPDSEGMTQEELIFKTFVKTFITLSSNSTQVIFRTNFRQNPVFRGIELYENGSEVPEIVPVKKDPIKVKFNLYNFDEASDSIKDLIANSNHVTIKPDPSALEILINKQDGGLLSCFFKIITDNFSTDWMSGNEFDWHLSQGRFKFLPTDPLDESGELFLENGLFVNLANFRDDASGSKQTDKVKIEIRAAWVYNGGWEEEGSIDYGTLPLKIKVRSTTGGYKNMDLLTTIQELNRTTPVVDVGESEPMSLSASNVNENTKAICRVEYDMQTRLIEIINYGDQTSTSTTTTTTTTSTTTTTTTTTTTEAPTRPVEIDIDRLRSDVGFDDEASFNIVVYFLLDPNRQFKLSFYTENNVLVKDTELKDAFLDGEIEDRFFTTDNYDETTSYGYTNFKVKTAFTVDNKFFLKRFFLVVTDTVTGIVYKKETWQGQFFNRFVYPYFLGLKQADVFETIPYKETITNYSRNAYTDPDTNAPPIELFWDKRANGDYSNNAANYPERATTWNVGVWQKNEINVPVVLHLKVVTKMSGWRSDSDYRNIVGADLQLRFFKKAISNLTSYNDNYKNYREEIFLPYKYSEQTNILAIEVKENDFSFLSSNSNTQQSELIFVLIGYGKPFRDVGYFKIGASKTKYKNGLDEIIYTKKNFTAYVDYNNSYYFGFGSTNNPSKIVEAVENLPNYVPPIFNPPNRRKLINTFLLVTKLDNGHFDEPAELIEKRYIPIDSFYCGNFIGLKQKTPESGFNSPPIEVFITSLWDEFAIPLNSLEVSFWNIINFNLSSAEKYTVDGVTELGTITDIFSPAYSTWLNNRTSSELSSHLTLNTVDEDIYNVVGGKKIVLGLSSWITPPSEVWLRTRKKCVCEVKINDEFIFFFKIEIEKLETYQGYPNHNTPQPWIPKNQNQFLSVSSITKIDLDY